MQKIFSTSPEKSSQNHTQTSFLGNSTASNVYGDGILESPPRFSDVDPWLEMQKDENDARRLPNVVMEAFVKTGLMDEEGQVMVKEVDCDVDVQSRTDSAGGMKKKVVLVIDGLRYRVTSRDDGKYSSPVKCPVSTYPRNVYLRKGVEVQRDFPPFCGWNAPKPTEEELKRIIRNKGTVADQVDVGVDIGMLEDSSKRGCKKRPFDDAGSFRDEMKDRVHVKHRPAFPDELWRKGKGSTRKETRHPRFTHHMKSRDGKDHGVISLKSPSKIFMDEEDCGGKSEEKNDDCEGPCSINVALPPFGPKDSNDARNRVRETRRLFQAACRKLLQGEEAKLRPGEGLKKSQKHKAFKRIDYLAADYIRREGKVVNGDKKILGSVPGVDVGDEFQYRAELAIVGVHGPYQGGIDYMKHRGEIVAISIVASGGYDDEVGSDVLIYSGQGGNIAATDKHKPAADQKLERGNLALKNSISAKTPVRVVRGSKETKAAESSKGRSKIVMSYVYDGLYTVVKYKQAPGPRDNKLVFKFELRRIPGQPDLSWKEVKKAKKHKIREGLCVADISGGRELVPICAVNTMDSDKPPAFNYIAWMKYPSQYCPAPPKGCQCMDGCLNFEKCSCAFKNGGGEVPVIPYNHNGAIVEPRTLVYECGPHCKCPPSCYNRVTQHGIKIPLEIFKTKSKGWGVRSLNFVPSGSFICEYTGEILEDTEAEKRVGQDEYLFNIGQNYKDCCPEADEKLSSSMDAGFCIDAMKYGNVGRFINHSCSPNLYAQNVVYDHGDKRMPHIMLFAAENIPPLQELTYHYNYAVDTVHDSHGNVKEKRCFCGSNRCNGRLY